MNERRSWPAGIFRLVAVLVGILSFAVSAQAQSVPRFLGVGSGMPAESGAELKIFARFGGTGPMTFRWRRNGVDVATTTGDPDSSGFVTHFVVPVAQSADEGTYVVEATNGAGTTASAIFPVFLSTPRSPEFVVQSGDLRGPEVNYLTVFVSGSWPFVRRWFRDGSNSRMKTGRA